MANRAILGNPGNGFQFKISRPGANVLSAGNDDLMMNGVNPLLQIVQKGKVVCPMGGENSWTYVDVAIANQGFNPLVLLHADGNMTGSIQYLSTTLIRIGAFHLVGASEIGVRYLVTNQRFN